MSREAGAELQTRASVRARGENTTPRSNPDQSPSSAPNYIYRSKILRELPTEVNYFYSLRDLFQLRKAFIEKIEKNETLKAEKLLSSSESNHFNNIYLLVSLPFALQLV